MRKQGAWAAMAAGVCVALLAACGSAQDVATSPDLTSTDPATPVPTSTPTTSATSSTSPAPSSGAPQTTGSSEAPGKLPAGMGDGPAGEGISRFYDQQVDWVDCGDGNSCADVWVPLDYDAPDGPAITIKAKRDPADDRGHKLGSLFINPGGPGGSGIDYVGYANFDPAITDVYDVVGFDPRGVGTSTPVDCITDSEVDEFVAADPSPDTEQEIAQFEQSWARYTAGCVANSGPLLRHVSTVEVARDLDVLRAVVGDRSLHYFGASYGTYIGATYAALFPDNVGRMVLDGAVDPLASPHRTELGQAVGFETALTAYLKDCVDTGTCPLGGDVGTARDRVASLMSDLDANPLPTSGGRELTEGLGFLGVIVPLYSRTTWSYLTQGFEGAVQGEGDVLLSLSDAYTQRQLDGTYPSNSLEVQSAVNCLDHPEHESVAQIEAGAAEFERRAPVFGPAAAWFGYGCSNWPVPRIQPVPDFSAKGAAPIVVVGTTRDPATPYQQSVNLARELDSGVLLSRNGDGHTAYDSGNTCIDTTVDAYLTDGTVPQDGTTC
ncbi:MAG: alpha/beta fold hydrolase [Propionibacteriales bacterium]|nr:alpha/beta fold hydrolase [Propionibacteriales bacterium]